MILASSFLFLPLLVFVLALSRKNEHFSTWPQQALKHGAGRAIASFPTFLVFVNNANQNNI